MAPAAVAHSPVSSLPIDIPVTFPNLQSNYNRKSHSDDVYTYTIRANPNLTSGQHDILPSTLLPYDAYPKEVLGQTVWEAKDYIDRPEKWVIWWNEEEIADLERAAKEFEESGLELTEISQDNFRLSPALATQLGAIREDLINGKGFTLLKGLPVHRYSLKTSATIYTGLGTYIGHAVSQNHKGHILGHVKDLGNDPTQIDKVRIYSTNARQYFHADDSDLVGLLCLEKAFEGGESDIVSSHHVWNVLQRERPDVVKTLTQLWYFDRKGEVSQGEKGWFTNPIYSYYHGHLIGKWDPYFVRSLDRFIKAGLIPPLSAPQLDAIEVLEQACQRESLHMILDVGDIQFVSNLHVFHARTAYRDHAPETGKKRRHLFRLWLATSEEEGGWALPFPDSRFVKRGGIQVDDTPPRCPLDAE
ncbi:hypothetical protein YB2330_003198 [Saitoella coloradoensis]